MCEDPVFWVILLVGIIWMLFDRPDESSRSVEAFGCPRCSAQEPTEQRVATGPTPATGRHLSLADRQ